jgi:stage V sporulation protein SpoVS
MNTPKPYQAGAQFVEPEPKIPETPVTETPEFLAAIAAHTARAVAEAEARIAGQIAEALKSRGGDAAAEELFRKMAMSLVELTEQGQPQAMKRLPPEVIAAREAAAQKMVERVVRARREKDTPHYRVLDKVYIADRVIEPYRADPQTKAAVPVVIEFTGVPNDSMMPLNDVAKEIFALFREATGGATQAVTSGKWAQTVEALAITPGGLVVRGLSPAARRTVANLDPPQPDPYAEDLRVMGNNDPRATEIRVLGHIAPPARQNGPSDIPFMR